MGRFHQVILVQTSSQFFDLCNLLLFCENSWASTLFLHPFRSLENDWRSFNPSSHGSRVLGARVKHLRGVVPNFVIDRLCVLAEVKVRKDWLIVRLLVHRVLVHVVDVSL